MSFQNSNQNSPKIRAEEELKFISMADDMEEHFSPEKKKHNLWEIQPWKNQQESPSRSPQRRVYIPRPSPAHGKNEKPNNLQNNTIKSKKILESNNHCNFCIKLRSISRKKHQIMEVQPIQCENSRPSTKRGNYNSSRKNSLKQRRKNGTIESHHDSAQEGFYSFKEPVNMIVYPLINQNKKKRLFKKMERFTNFVSMSLRK